MIQTCPEVTGCGGGAENRDSDCVHTHKLANNKRHKQAYAFTLNPDYITSLPCEFFVFLELVINKTSQYYQRYVGF